MTAGLPPAHLALLDPQVAREFEIAAANLLDEALGVVAQIGRGFTKLRPPATRPISDVGHLVMTG